MRLDDEGLADNTIVFFMSDHGRAHIRCKQFLYDGGIHIPLIVRWPRQVDAGVVSDALISGVDVAPTTLSLTGTEIPDLCKDKPSSVQTRHRATLFSQHATVVMEQTIESAASAHTVISSSEITTQNVLTCNSMAIRNSSIHSGV